ncbi:MAG TPA: hypothetical protein VFU36_03525 [Jatrophihabitans sp.]|nr:hypothetical protein [Jatrophihabitans sp.]
MLLALALLLLLCLPFLVPGVCRVVHDQWEQIAAQRHPAGLTSHSIERVAADLRRLRQQLELRENHPGTAGKGMRMAALRRAYVEVLCTACRQLEVRPPQQSGQWETPLAEIYRVESELRARGLDVRPGRRDRRAA